MAKKKKEKKKETFLEFISSMSGVLVTGLFIITFCLQAFEIPSSSMENTLLIGDHVFVDRVRFAPETGWMGPLVPYREVRRGDVVVFLSPIEPGLHVVKRVIGVPGDRIRMENGNVFVNGKPLEEPYRIRTGGDADRERITGGRIARYDPYRDDFPAIPPSFGLQVSQDWRISLSSYVNNGELVVPEGRYFAMGDNRDESYDSRYWGFIPHDNLIGRPMFIYWSFDSPRESYQRTSMVDRVSNILNVVIHFFDKTRWSRTLKPVR